MNDSTSAPDKPARVLRLPAPLRSLQFKLVLAIVGVTIGFVWALAIYTAARLEDQIRAMTMDKQFAVVEYLAADLDQKVQERLDGLRGIAEGLDLSRMGDHAYLQKFLESRYVLQMQFTGGTAIIDADGRTIADHPAAPGRRGTYYGDRDYFKQAVATRKPYIDKPIMGRALKRPVMTMSTPLIDAAGEVRGVMTGIVDLTAPNFLGLMTDRILGNFEFFVVSTEHGMFVAASDAKRVMTSTPAPGKSEIHDALLAGLEGTKVARSSFGIEKLYAVKRMPSTGWTVELALPTTVAFAPATTLRSALYGTAMLASLIAVLIVGLIARRLLRPIEQATARLDDMSSGRIALERLPETGDTEVRRLIASFNRLTDHMTEQQAELRLNEIRLAESQRIAHVGSWEWELATNRNIWSAETFRIFGFDPHGTAPGFDAFIALVDADDRQKVIDAKQKALDGTASYHCEYRIQRPSGEIRIVRSQAEVVRDEQGAALRMVGINADVTERRKDEMRLRESEATYRSLFDNMLNGFAYCRMLFGADGKAEDFVYLSVNEAFGTLTGLRNVVGRRVSEVIPGIRESDPVLIETYGRVATTGKPERFEARLAALDMWFSVSVYSPKPEHFVAVFDVVTERKQQELQIVELNRTLEARVKLRTKDLERANRELEAFSYSISHDLRAPLRAINGFSQLLLESERDKLATESLHMLERVAHNASRMGELIDDILDYSRSGRADMKTTNVDMGALANAVVDQLRDNYPATQFHCGALPSVRGDATMLRQVLLNLIDNAGKFSSHRADARVDVDCATKAGEHVFSVRDNGAGFEMRYADKLFGMFQRMHSEAQFPGTGVGLAIVKRLAERHGGRVWAEAEPERGATFYFALPFSA